MFSESGVFGGIAQTRWERNLLAQRDAGGFGETAQQGSIKNSRSNGHDANTVAGDFARDRQGHAHDATLGGRVRGLTDLAIKCRDRSRVDNHTALAPRVWLVFSHSRNGQANSVKGANQIDADDFLEASQAVNTGFADDFLSNADTRAVDQNMQATALLNSGAHRRLDRLFVGNICLRKKNGSPALTQFCG